MSNEENKDFQNKAMGAAPKWAVSICGILLVFAISLKIIGINISPPISTIMNAHALRIEFEAKNSNPSIPTELMQRVKSLEEEDMQKVKEVAHEPKSTQRVFK